MVDLGRGSNTKGHRFRFMGKCCYMGRFWRFSFMFGVQILEIIAFPALVLAFMQAIVM
jgi:hypothetical protein